jgi:hypothetical protein
MKKEKLSYEEAKLDVLRFGDLDVISTSENTGYVDPDGWDSTVS